MPLLAERRQLVAPGELLAEGEYFPGENTYKQSGKVYASRIGLFDFTGTKLYVVPLTGCYIPNVGDLVVSRVVDVGLHGWTVDIRAPYQALLPASETYSRNSFERDLSKIYDVGDLLILEVLAFDRTRDPLTTAKGPGLGRITAGRVVEISPAKVPRLIGKKGSMVEMIKRETNCNITVGQNGIVVISGKAIKNELAAISAVYKIENEAHTRGLTDRTQLMIRNELGIKHDIVEKT